MTLHGEPEGIAHLIMMASTRPIQLPEWKDLVLRVQTRQQPSREAQQAPRPRAAPQLSMLVEVISTKSDLKSTLPAPRDASPLASLSRRTSPFQCQQ